MMRASALVFAVLPIFASPAVGENDFDSLVRRMESQYGTRKTYIPMMGFANFLVKVARPVGTRDFKLAIFEHVDSRRHPSGEELDRTFRPNGWRPFVRILSKRNHERVQIYAREFNRDHELLITTFEDNKAVMVRVRVNAESLARWVNNPVSMGRSKGRWDED